MSSQLTHLPYNSDYKADNKADKDLSNCTRPYVIETYVNGYSYYRVWSDGYCEQGGMRENPPVSDPLDGTTLTLLKPYKDKESYIIITTINKTGEAVEAIPSIRSCVIRKKEANSFNIATAYWNKENNGRGNYKVFWETKGYIS